MSNTPAFETPPTLKHVAQDPTTALCFASCVTAATSLEVDRVHEALVPLELSSDKPGENYGSTDAMAEEYRVTVGDRTLVLTPREGLTIDNFFMGDLDETNAVAHLEVATQPDQPPLALFHGRRQPTAEGEEERITGHWILFYGGQVMDPMKSGLEPVRLEPGDVPEGELNDNSLRSIVARSFQILAPLGVTVQTLAK